MRGSTRIGSRAHAPDPTLTWAAPRRPSGRTLVGWTLIAGAVAATAILWLGWPLPDPSGGSRVFRRIIEGAIRPELSLPYLRMVLGDAVVTTAYAITAMSLATVAGLAGAIAASGVLVDRLWIRAVVRTSMALIRAPHELVWGLLFVYAAGLSPSAGILAIAVPYSGTIGRVLGDALQDVDARPLVALESAGASRAARLAYGVTPQVIADVVGYLAYRFECALRSAAVLSFVGLGGLGQRIELALLDLDYARAWTPIYATILLVVVVDRLGARYRRSFAR